MTEFVHLSIRRTDSTPEGYGTYAFKVEPATDPHGDQVPWCCDTCQWWEVLPELTGDPSGRRGACRLAELQDHPDADREGQVLLKRFLVDEGTWETSPNFGCTEWQVSIVSASEPWLPIDGDKAWLFPGVEVVDREREDFPDGGWRPGGRVFSYKPPRHERILGAPEWACSSCRWCLTSTAYVHWLRGGSCWLGEKDDRQPTATEGGLSLKAKTTGYGLDIAMDFGCAMWNDERYEGLPRREWEEDED